jgi:diguanylate cyclase (GGDEF)-like protein
MDSTGFGGTVATFVTLIALTWAGLLFMWASVPYREKRSSQWMFTGLVLTNTVYFELFIARPQAEWPLTLAAILFGVVPLCIASFSLRQLRHPLRWTLILLYSFLAAFLLRFQHHPGNGGTLAVNAILFSIYFSCCIHVLILYRRPTAGATITIAGFFCWASVFIVSPIMSSLLPQVHVESGVWNLPKYLVAVGMILLLLENQIEDNKYLALHDPLTGLPNRRLFEDRMASALERSRRSESQMALMLIDLDNFKEINDTLGHHMGDLVLQHVASVFVERVRRSDTVSRTGGDEFSVILEEPTNREKAENVERSLRQLLDEPVVLGSHTVQIGASIGIAVYPQDAADAESLCIAADRRMYEAKHSARGLKQDVSSEGGNAGRTRASENIK